MSSKQKTMKKIKQTQPANDKPKTKRLSQPKTIRKNGVRMVPVPGNAQYLTTEMKVKMAGTRTREGRAWLKKVLDPAGPHLMPQGLPSGLSCNVVTPFSKPEFILQLPTTGFTPDLKAANFNKEIPWNVVFIAEPNYLAYFSLFYQGTIGDPQTVYYIRTDRADFFNQVITHEKSRLTFHGTTIEYTGSTIENQGEATHVQLNSTREQLTGLVGGSVKNIRVWPLVTNKLDAATTLPLEKLALFLQNLKNVDTLAARMDAKLGAYIVHKINSDNQEMVRMEPYNFRPGVSSTGALIINPFEHFFRPMDFGKGAESENYLDAGYARDSFWNTSVSWFNGISPTASFRVKINLGAESTVEPGAFEQSYSHQPPEVDKEAIRIATTIGAAMQSAYPASHNFLGDLWKIIKNIGRDVLPEIGNLVPVIGPVLRDSLKKHL